ncbi:MAG: hypothetical protein JXM79_10630 [Sedimentisphaerales bacterium]|nr:hypothetical protein [Sedimentisphaerales bacterium]
MKPEERIKGLINESDVVTGPESDERILGDALEHLEKLKKPGRAGTQRNIWSTIGKLAAAAMIVIAALVGIYQFAAPGVAWADVAARFRTVPFFGATIYIKDYALLEPRQLELWMGPEGRARMRIGQQVIFGRPDQALKAFDIRRRMVVEPDQQAVELLDMLGDMEEYSLETVIRSISGGKLVDVTPLVNADAVISEDMVVFDVPSNDGPEWLRVYALRESRLPVGIRMWNPRGGSSVDVFISYFRRQPDEFFDASTFTTTLSDQSYTEVDLAHVFLKDPGGRFITEKDMREGKSNDERK